MMFSLSALHGDGLNLFRAESDEVTMKITKDDVTVMVGERMASQLYILQACTVVGGVIRDGVAISRIVGLPEDGGSEAKLDSSGGSL